MTVNVFGAGLLPASARKPRLLRKACLAALKSEKFRGSGEISIILTDRKKMLALNETFLRHDHDTDVIAFNYDPPNSPREPFGDVYISVPQARAQASELGHPLLQEILTLIIHGTLHLLGHEDSTPRKKARMFARQDRILSSLSRPKRRIRRP
ncbi:MAG: rRNA maturation RNase YbeY [Elusimicrobia bacterium]|nr:rRNA maturation RNase YbeY [Elusimicrobiota bacterium]